MRDILTWCVTWNISPKYNCQRLCTPDEQFMWSFSSVILFSFGLGVEVTIPSAPLIANKSI